MEKSLTLSVLYLGFFALATVNSFPIDISTVSEGVSNPLWLANYFLTGLGFFLIIASVIFGCVCCRNGKGFKQNDVKVIQEFRNSSGNLTISQAEEFVNPTLNPELTIFPPLGANANEICRFEPLPDIKRPTQNIRPAAFTYTEQEISSQDWFSNPSNNFPRHQLKYVEEYGRGWFGRVVEGEAQSITPEEKVTKVMVKILHEDATPTDHMYFLHEVKFYRDLKHPNILRLLGQCLETEPFLIILECYPNGDLKTFLSQNLASAQALVEQGVTLQMCSNITSGLQFMHDNKFIHTDLAARNCLVGPDLSIKIGDYGNSIEIFKSDYYCAGSVALPVRWCAPETLKCTDITIETREVTPPANIWSLGVVFWEICEFCKLPYAELNDDQVIVRVLGEKNYFLEKPNMICLHRDEMYHLMKLCWKPPIQRPSASQINLVLNNLISSSKMIQKEGHSDSKQISHDFEQRWQNLEPNSIPKKDNAIDLDQSITVDCNIISSKLKNAKVVDSSYIDSPLGIFLSNKSGGSQSPRFTLKYDKKPNQKLEKNPVKEICQNENINSDLGNDVSKNSIGQIYLDHTIDPGIREIEKVKATELEMDSWLKGVEINNEEDESFVRKISEAIRDLDATLALEKTSSSEENSGKSSRQNSPGKDLKEGNEIVVDFKLGNDTSSFINFTQKNFDITSLQNSEQPQSLNFTDSFNNKNTEEAEDFGPNSLIMPFVEDATKKTNKGEILYESLKENDSSLCGQSRNSSDTDDEIWRRRIEKGEISEKVKEKSKSIANLMILTHIDSDDSDIDFDKPFEKGVNRGSLIRRSGSFAKSSLSSNNFGSENDLTFAVLEDDFKESLKKLTSDHKERGHFDSLGVILPSSANRENVWESLFKPSDPSGGASVGTVLAQTALNNTLTDSELGTGNFQTVNCSGEKFEKNPEKGNNFLGNVASEKFENNVSVEANLMNCACSSGLKKNCCLREDENKILLEKYLCDREKYNNSVSDSPLNSSHLIQGSEGSEFDVHNCESQISFLKNISNESSSFEKKPVEAERPAVLKLLTLEDENFLLGETDVNENVESLNMDLSSKCNLPPIVNKAEESLYSKDTESSEIHLQTVNEAKKDIESDDNLIDSVNTKLKSFERIFEKSHFIPQITITEEPNEDVDDLECEKFEFERPTIRPLKFVLRNDDDVTSTDEIENRNNERTSSESFFPAVSDKFIIKNSGNDSEKYTLNENATVIVGACEDFTLDYFKGLKTTSEDLNVEKNNVEQITKAFQGNDENLDIWDKHLEKVFSQHLCNTNFDDVSFKSFGLNDFESRGTSEVQQFKNFNAVTCLVSSIVDFIESEKNHTEKLQESIHLNRLTNLSVIANEEEYEHFKLRTPDDERSSDSGFRDKGSLSESVEDACEGKYNLEDIEAELEEAFVTGVFRNCETDKEKYSTNESKNCINFEYTESKFYEDESKNEEDFSDIDGEIEFWHNKDESDYYPEISEFHPTSSQGWYLHPPDESTLNYDRNVNEDIVNALRNELRENLPIQSRTYDEFNDFYESEIKNAPIDLSIPYISDFALPLSPILEEEDVSNVTIKKNIKNALLDGNNSNKVRKNIVKLMESVKSVDTNTFMQYLDYMIENEGRDLNEIEELEENVCEKKENSSPALILKEDNFKGCTNNFSKEDIVSKSQSYEKGNCDEILLEYLQPINPIKHEDLKRNDDILVVNLKTNEATLLENEAEYFDDTPDQKNDCLEISTDISENEGLVFTPEMLSPDRERSLSEISRSSNGTRTGDALSEITLSSPDLIPDCFSTSAQEITPNNEVNEIRKTETKTPLNSFDDVISHNSITENPELSCFSTKYQERNFLLTKEKNHASEDLENKILESPQNSISDFGNLLVTNNAYEMSTSFMGDEEEDEMFSNSVKCEPNIGTEEQTLDQKSLKDSATEDSDTAEWQLDTSEDEDMSSSSGEFVWKLYEKSENKQRGVDRGISEPTSPNKNINEKEKSDEDYDEIEDDDNESSTGSSASITDFVPSAWNSQAIPSRSALRNTDKKADKQKKNVWFKKQKYHCVYEYPREPSDNEDADVSPLKQSNFDINLSETPIKHFNYGVNRVELPNQHFPYGISKVIDFSTFADWDVIEGEDPDLSLTDTDSENGTGKSDLNVPKKSDSNFYNLSPFDYDFNITSMPEGESEFFVSSSSRPFQGGSSTHGSNQSLFNNIIKAENEIIKSKVFNFKDFITPDSGVEDSANVTPSGKLDLSQENVLKLKNVNYSKPDIINLLDNLKFNSTLEMKENEQDIDLKMIEVNTKSKNGFSSPDAAIPLSNIGLGELRHTRSSLKLDLPRNHNTELGAILNKKNQ